jgi:hypothetical protein
MKEIQFTNKVWISQKGKLLDIVLNVCCWVYLLLDIVVILMEGFSAYTIFSFVAAVIIILWTSVHIKNNGKYEETDCKITFSKSKIVWEYLNINMPIYKGQAHIIYNIDAEKIKSISLSNKIQSIRVECSPLVECINEKKKKTVDYRKNNKSCVLIIYNYNVDEIRDLFLQYIGKTVDIID